MSVVNIVPPILSAKQIVRFWKLIDRSPGQGPLGNCWEWAGARLIPANGNYGLFSVIRKDAKKRYLRAHRVAFFLTTGKWSERLILHECDNPPCCNPAHLREGTSQDNADDKVSRWRVYRPVIQHPARGEKCKGAKLTEQDVIKIRESVNAGRSQTELASEYGVDQSNISKIVKRHIWAHI